MFLPLCGHVQVCHKEGAHDANRRTDPFHCFLDAAPHLARDATTTTHGKNLSFQTNTPCKYWALSHATIYGLRCAEVRIGLYLLVDSLSKPPARHGRQLTRDTENHQLTHPQDLDLHNCRLPASITLHRLHIFTQPLPTLKILTMPQDVRQCHAQKL